MSSMINRRDFVKLSALSVGSLVMPNRRRGVSLPDFPVSERLGRVVSEGLRLRARPNPDSTEIRRLSQDEILPIIQTVVGVNPYRVNQNWVQTPEGYAWSPEIQPVRHFPNEPVESLPNTSPVSYTHLTLPTTPYV